jgi:uncharacterized integral membrane protein
MKVLWWIIGVPIALLLVMLAVANHDPVMLSLDPTGDNQPSVSLPLYLVIYIAFVVGLVVGSILTWATGVRRRIRKRREEREKAQGDRDPDRTPRLPTSPTVPF